MVLKKCKKPDDVLIINAADHFEKSKRQNQLLPEHIDKILGTYQQKEEIAKNDFNLNITRYVSTAEEEPEIDLGATHQDLTQHAQEVEEARTKHNAFLKELGLPPLM